MVGVSPNEDAVEKVKFFIGIAITQNRSMSFLKDGNIRKERHVTIC